MSDSVVVSVMDDAISFTPDMEKLAAPVDAVYFSLLKLIPSPGRGNAIFGVHFDHISTDSQRNAQV